MLRRSNKYVFKVTQTWFVSALVLVGVVVTGKSFKVRAIGKVALNMDAGFFSFNVIYSVFYLTVRVLWALISS